MKNYFLVVILISLCLLSIAAASHHIPTQRRTLKPLTSLSTNALTDASNAPPTGFKVYMDAAHGFSLLYPAAFLESMLSNWYGLVDNDTKAQTWIGFCPPGCNHLVRTPNAQTVDEYKQDYVVTWRESSDIPAGEGRRIHIVESHEFTTSKGVPALKQHYATTGFDAATGKPITLYCAEDTPCTGMEPPALRYVFFSQDKEPYVLAVKSYSQTVQSIIDTASY